MKSSDLTEKIIVDIASKSLLFVDTCSILNPGFSAFMKIALPILKVQKRTIIIPMSCIGELKRLSADEQDPSVAKKANMALRNIDNWRKEGEPVEIKGDANDDQLADNVFLYVFTRLRRKSSLTLITQDKALCKDLCSLNESGSVLSKHKIQVYHLSRTGRLFLYCEEKKQVKNVPEKKKVKATIDKFRVCTVLNSEPDEVNQVSEIPGAGAKIEAVYKDKTVPVILGDRVAGGGEGDIYRTNTPYLAKIYKKQKNTVHKKAKLELMLRKDIQHEAICYPVAILNNSAGEFVGYLMPEARGYELMKSVFIPALFRRRFPDWKKVNTVRLCLTILRTIEYLHERNVLLGDINPGNILVESDSKVYFVDTDSYQIEGYPCPVGMVNFTAPEIMGNSYSSFLRTRAHEHFAVAALLFMIMLPGKAPYAQQGGEDPVENVKRMNFSYPFEEASNKKTPDGPWRFMWSHLSYKIKKSFYGTFHKNGEYSAPAKRLSVKSWINLFTNYERSLTDGTMATVDELSLSLFPQRHKMIAGLKYCTCKICNMPQPEEYCTDGYCNKCLYAEQTFECNSCGNSFNLNNKSIHIYRKSTTTCPECIKLQQTEPCKLCGNRVYKKQLKSGYCQSCLNKTEQYHCSRCGGVMSFSNYERYVKRKKRHTICYECHEYQNSVGQYITCCDCSCSFSLTNREIEYFNSKGLQLPKRCKDCRENKRSSSSGYSSGGSSGSGGMCYITTAVCGIMGKADDCPELQSLRHYRDTWLKLQPGGSELITEYYSTAPALAAEIQSHPQRERIADILYHEYLLPCIEYIQQQQYESCRDHYIRMVAFVSSIC